MKIERMMRLDFMRGLNALLRMDGRAWVFFPGSRRAIFLALSIVVMLSVAVYCSLSFLSPKLSMDASDLARVALSEICQYLIILTFIHLAAEKYGMTAQWSRCASAVLWATALTNALLVLSLLVSCAVIKIFTPEASPMGLGLTGIPFVLSIYLIVTMSRLIHNGLNLLWKQVMVIMLSCLFGSLMLVQCGSLLNREAYIGHPDASKIEKALPSKNVPEKVG